MRAPASVRSAEALGRVRLSHSFFMRDFLYSEIASIHGMVNLPDEPDLAIAAGRGLCEHLLEPLQATFGRLAIRSSYRSPEVNAYGCRHRISCASNEKNFGRHIWDRRGKRGMGAVACIVIPWLVDRMETGANWQAMAWWISSSTSCISSRRRKKSRYVICSITSSGLEIPPVQKAFQIASI
jgi:hypothetical protein